MIINMVGVVPYFFILHRNSLKIKLILITLYIRCTTLHLHTLIRAQASNNTSNLVRLFHHHHDLFIGIFSSTYTTQLCCFKSCLFSINNTYGIVQDETIKRSCVCRSYRIQALSCIDAAYNSWSILSYEERDGMSSRCCCRFLCPSCYNHHHHTSNIFCQKLQRKSSLYIGNRLASFPRSFHVLVFNTCAVYILPSIGESCGEARTFTGEFNHRIVF